MKALRTHVALACWALLFSGVLLAQEAAGLEAELSRLKVSMALVVPSQAVDDYPVWSPDGRHLAVNIMGTWLRLDLTKVKLKEAQWLGMRIGAPEGLPKSEKIQAEELETWKRSTKRAPRKLDLESGKTIELRQKAMSTLFLVREPGGKETVLWKTDLENCYEMTAPQGERFIAFICETNGVLITRTP